MMIPLLAGVLSGSAFDLDAMRWQKRIVLVFAPTLQETALQKQSKTLSQDPCGVAERHLVLVTAGKDGGVGPDDQVLDRQSAEALRRRFRVAPESFAVLLVGKDGDVKLRSPTPVSRRELYSLLDGMPMRRSEMRKVAQEVGSACDG